MLINLDSQQTALIEKAAAFARELGSPGRDEALRTSKSYSTEGYTSLLVDREYGGGGYDYQTAGLICETLGYHSLSTMPSVITSTHCSEILRIAGTEKQKEKYLTAISRDHALFSFGLTEFEAGSDITGLETTARREKENYILNGTKSISINAGVADYFIITAREPGSRGRAGLDIFLVPADAPGITVSPHIISAGFGGTSLNTIILEDVEIPSENLIGEPGSGYFLLMETFDKGRPLVASACVGASQRAFDLALQHSKERQQFGHELYYFQDISFRFADFDTRIQAARLLFFDALSRIDADEEFTRHASSAKLYASELLRDISRFGLDLMGYRSYTAHGSEMQELFHDAQLMMSIDGSANVQRMVIASQL